MRAALMSAVVAALLAPRAGAAPSPEVVREERFNYRIVGTLPHGWKRTPDQLVFTYSVDGIPLAYVHFVRERIAGEVDVQAELERRAVHYRFPGAPETPVEKVASTRWGDREAFRYEHELTLAGVECRRIVHATMDQGIWYECIETLYGEPAPAVASGLACFRSGFLLLTPRMPGADLASPTARTINDAIYGFSIEKPEGYLLEQPNPGADPGCRLAMVRRGPAPGQQLSVRLFEYGVRESFDAAHWLDLLDGAFRRSHAKAQREAIPAPGIKGSSSGHGMRLLGRRDEQDVVTTIYLWQSASRRVYGLRIVSHADAQTTHAASLKALIESLAFTGRER